MIIGIGADITGLERIGRLLEGERGGAFLRRALTEAERHMALAKSAHRGRYVEFVAGRWAAKEAVAKAVGCGIGAIVGLHDIEVLPDDRGRPVCTLSGQAWERLEALSPSLRRERVKLHLTITHSEGMAAAFAVAEQL
jgi:holo-[acyl-carrier protein] synthase